MAKHDYYLERNHSWLMIDYCLDHNHSWLRPSIVWKTITLD